MSQQGTFEFIDKAKTQLTVRWMKDDKPQQDPTKVEEPMEVGRRVYEVLHMCFGTVE